MSRDALERLARGAPIFGWAAEGCVELQGFLFSPAVPAGAFTRFLEREKLTRPDAEVIVYEKSVSRNDPDESQP